MASQHIPSRTSFYCNLEVVDDVCRIPRVAFASMNHRKENLLEHHVLCNKPSTLFVILYYMHVTDWLMPGQGEVMRRISIGPRW